MRATIWRYRRADDWSELEKVVRTNQIEGKKVKMKVSRGKEVLDLVLVTGELINSYTENKQLMSGFGKLIFAYDDGTLVYSEVNVKRVTSTLMHYYHLITELI